MYCFEGLLESGVFILSSDIMTGPSPSPQRTYEADYMVGSILGKKARIKSHINQPIGSEPFYPQSKLIEDCVSTLLLTMELGTDVRNVNHTRSSWCGRYLIRQNACPSSSLN